jgi:hypothetical protein
MWQISDLKNRIIVAYAAVGGGQRSRSCRTTPPAPVAWRALAQAAERASSAWGQPSSAGRGAQPQAAVSLSPHDPEGNK